MSESGPRPSAPNSPGSLGKVFRALSGERSQQIQMRVYALLLFILGNLLAFNDKVFDFLSNFTSRPEILPATLMIPYIYFIFQMVLSHLDRDEEAELEEIRFEERSRELPERRLERKSAVKSFGRSHEGLLKVPQAKASEWIGERASAPEIEVLLLAYSSETSLKSCLDSVDFLRAHIADNPDGPRPQKVRFKLLTRDLDAVWKVPYFPAREADKEYRNDLKAGFRRHLARWPVELPEKFQGLLYRDQIEVEIKYYPFEPLLKGIVVNREIGMVGIYEFHQPEHRETKGWDYHGWGSSMFEMSSLDPAATNATDALTDFITYFDEIWNHYSRGKDA